MKTINKTIAIFAIAASMIACTEEEMIAPVVPNTPNTPGNPANPIDSISMISELQIDLPSAGGSSTYKINYNDLAQVSSIEFFAYDGTYGGAKTTPVIYDFTWNAAHNVLTMDPHTGATRAFAFSPDSLLESVQYFDHGTLILSRVYQYDATRALSVTDIGGDNSGQAVHLVNYTDNKITTIDYYNMDMTLNSTFTAGVGSNVNPIASIKNLELLLMLWDEKLHEVFFMSKNEVTSTYWGASTDIITYNFADGNLTEINMDSDINTDTFMTLSYKAIAVK